MKFDSLAQLAGYFARHNDLAVFPEVQRALDANPHEAIRPSAKTEVYTKRGEYFLGQVNTYLGMETQLSPRAAVFDSRMKILAWGIAAMVKEHEEMETCQVLVSLG